MRGELILTLDDGSVHHGVVEFHQAKHSGRRSQAAQAAPAEPSVDLDFTLPVRPFMNECADGLSGSKKFALLVAHFAKGEVDVAVDRTEVVDAWNKMTGLLGGKFNGAHESRAKDSGYIYVPAVGKLALLKKWRQAVS